MQNAKRNDNAQGLSFNIVFLLSLLVYYYPILCSDELIWFSFSGVSSTSVNPVTILIVGCAFVLLFILTLSVPAPRQYWLVSNENKAESASIPILMMRILFVMSLIVFVVSIASLGFGLEGRSKAELFSEMGYELKLMQSFGLASFVSSLLCSRWKFTLANLVFPVVVLLYGVRELAIYCLIAYLLVNFRKAKVVRYILFITLFGLFLVAYKVLGYGQFSWDLVGSTFGDQINEYGPFKTIFLLANPESVGISAMLNKAVEQHFVVSYHYFVDLFLSPVPFLPFLDYVPVTLTDYMRESILSLDYFTFPPGFFVLGYSVGGFLGVEAMAIFLFMIFSSLERLGRNSRSFFIRTACLSILSVSILTIHRHEPIYFVSVIRGILGAVFISYITAILIHRSYFRLR
jgi:hypothetical protein